MHATLEGAFNPSNPFGKRPSSIFLAHIFVGIDQSRLAFSIKIRINDELFRIASWHLSFITGNAPEVQVTFIPL